MRYAIFMLVYVGLTAYCFVDALGHRDREPFGLHKFVWMALIILIPYIGAAAWLIIKIAKSRGGESYVEQGPIAPDDDPEYLNWLREQERRRKREGR